MKIGDKIENLNVGVWYVSTGENESSQTKFY